MGQGVLQAHPSEPGHPRPALKAHQWVLLGPATHEGVQPCLAPGHFMKLSQVWARTATILRHHCLTAAAGMQLLACMHVTATWVGSTAL